MMLGAFVSRKSFLLEPRNTSNTTCEMVPQNDDKIINKCKIKSPPLFFCGEERLEGNT